jgi:hypothetical protein
VLFVQRPGGEVLVHGEDEAGVAGIGVLHHLDGDVALFQQRRRRHQFAHLLDGAFRRLAKGDAAVDEDRACRARR